MPTVGDSGEGSSQVHRPPPIVEISVLELESKMNNLGWAIDGSTILRPSISKVYPKLREQDDEAYDPVIVSIGPLHHGKEKLLPMEKMKLQNLRRLLERCGGDKLAIYLKKIHRLLRNVREAYSENIELSDKEFAEMLVVDGCFLVQFLIDGAIDTICSENRYMDLTFSLHYTLRDIMLLENQIPFFVLEELFQEIVILHPELKKDGSNLVRLALRWLENDLPPKKRPRAMDVQHLLHLKHLSMAPDLVEDLPYRRSYRQLAAIPGKKLMNLISVPVLGLFYLILVRDLSGLFGAPERTWPTNMIPTAKELSEAGVALKRKATPEEYGKAFQLKVSFVDGTIEIPFLSVTDSTRCELKNVIAYEQTRYDVSSHFTSYCGFLNHIIDTPDDVAILRKSGILANLLGSDAAVAEMINGIGKEVLYDYQPRYNAQLYNDVAAFCEVPHHRWRANLVHNYFNSPWTIISLIAGFLLLLFTGLQTFYAIKQSMAR